MNSAGNSLKGLLTNKNTITIIGALIGVAVLYFGYNYQINKQVEQINVLIANKNIQPRTRITNEDVEVVPIARAMYDKMMGAHGTGISVLTDAGQLNGFVDGAYSNINALIPKGTPLIRGVNIVEKSAIPSSVLTTIPKGEIPFAFPINFRDTYGNAIMDGMYVDIYMRAINDENVTMLGKFLEDVKVLAVLDSSGRNVFENTDENRSPATLVFGVNEELHLLLRRASYIPSVELIPVPRTESIIDEEYKGDLRITSEYLKKFIEERTINVPVSSLPQGQ